MAHSSHRTLKINKYKQQWKHLPDYQLNSSKTQYEVFQKIRIIFRSVRGLEVLYLSLQWRLQAKYGEEMVLKVSMHSIFRGGSKDQNLPNNNKLKASGWHN